MASLNTDVHSREPFFVRSYKPVAEYYVHAQLKDCDCIHISSRDYRK